MGYGALDDVAIDKVYAFRKGSINNTYMAGDSLEPLNTKISFWRDLYKTFFSEEN